MKIDRANNSFGHYLVVGLMLTLLSPLALAQEDAPAWLDVRIMQVKADRGAEFQDLIAEITAALGAAGRPPVTVWQEVRGSLATYHLVTPLEAAGDLDEALGPPIDAGAWSALISRIVDTVESQRRLLLRNYPDIAIPAAEGSEPAELMLLRLRTIVTGGNGDYGDWLRDNYVPALADAGVQDLGVSRVVAGDSPGIWVMGTPIESWAQYDEPGLLADLSDREIEQLFGPSRALIETRENLVLRRRTDLMAP